MCSVVRVNAFDEVRTIALYVNSHANKKVIRCIFVDINKVATLGAIRSIMNS